MSTEPHTRPPSPECQRQPRHSPARFLASIILSLSAAYAAAMLIPHAIHWPAWAAGWLTSALNAVIGHALHSKAVGMNMNRFLIWGFTGNCLRMLILFSTICTFVLVTKGSTRGSFLISFFAGLFILMGCEIATLFCVSNRNNGDKRPAP